MSGRSGRTGNAALLCDRAGVERVQTALSEQDLDGWLLYDFHEQNPVARALIGLEWTTRRSFTLVPTQGDPVSLVHAIEHSSWRHWPWEKRSYAGWREMEDGLADLLSGCARVAMEVSARSSVPTLDLVPSGIVELVRETGVETVSSGNLVSAFYSRWTEEQLEGHRRYAAILPEIASAAFERAADAVRRGEPTTEGALSAWIRTELERRGLGVDHDCIVAIGPRAADPHYDPGPVGETIDRGDVLLIDLWGKGHEGDVPADQTWMGYLGAELPAEVAQVWSAARDARDEAVRFLERAHREGRPVRGLEVDDACRAVLEERGYGRFFVHRTGHSIDRDIHGSGPNLDNLETRDDRLLIPGVGFSIEPGVYIPNHLGVRTEVDVFFGPDGPEVTTPVPQESVFLLLADEG